MFEQTVPLGEKAAEAGRWPVSMPGKPAVTVPPSAAIVLLHGSPVTVTFGPVWDQLAFQPLCSDSPAAGQLKVRAQPSIGVAARLVMVIEPMKPPCQLLRLAGPVPGVSQHVGYRSGAGRPKVRLRVRRRRGRPV